MSTAGLLCIILGFVIMILLISNGLIAQGVLLSRDQKIQIFLNEYAIMNKHEKLQFINDYYTNSDIKSMCQLFNS
jgi:hypothetical protein